MMDVDSLLSIVENPTRRRILEALVREPHYPLQLSKELGVSQQAIMKNLSLMEQNGMVTSHRVNSNIGPQRTLYVPSTEFTLVIDMHSCMFSTRLIPSAQEEDETEDGEEHDIDDAMERVRELDRKIRQLDEQRAALVRARDRAVEVVMNSIPEDADYGQRKLIYNTLNTPSTERTGEEMARKEVRE